MSSSACRTCRRSRCSSSRRVKAGTIAAKAGRGAAAGVCGLKPATRETGTIVAGSQTTIDRLKKLQPAPRPEVAEGLSSGPATRRCRSSSRRATTRAASSARCCRGCPTKSAAARARCWPTGLQWAVAQRRKRRRSCRLSPSIQSKDADAAAALRGMIVSALQLAAAGTRKYARELPQLDDLARAAHAAAVRAISSAGSLPSKRGETTQLCQAARPAAASRSHRRRPRAKHEQPQADRPGAAQLSRHVQAAFRRRPFAARTASRCFRGAWPSCHFSSRGRCTSSSTSTSRGTASTTRS